MGKKTQTSKTKAKEKVKKLKKALKEIDNLEIGVYSIELHSNSEIDKYIIVIFTDKGEEIFKKDLSADEAKKISKTLNENSISNDYINEISEIFDELLENDIIEDYKIEVYSNDGKWGRHTFTITDIDVIIYLDEKTLKEIEKDEELSDYIIYTDDEPLYLYITVKTVLDSENIERWYLTYDNKKHYSKTNITYASKETVKKLIKAFSK